MAWPRPSARACYDPVTSETATNQNGHNQNWYKRKRQQTKTATKRYQNGHIHL